MSRLSAAVVDGKDTEAVLFAADVAPVPGLDGVHEVRTWESAHLMIFLHGERCHALTSGVVLCLV